MGKKAYLGDGVYAEFEGPSAILKLTTSDGLRETNVIYLEPEVIRDLLEFLTPLYLPDEES